MVTNIFSSRDVRCESFPEDFMEYNRQARENFENWKKEVGEKEVTRRYQTFEKERRQNYPSHWSEESIQSELSTAFRWDILKKENRMPLQKTYDDEFHQETKKYVQQNFFKQAELKTGWFPYRQGEEVIKINHWVMRGPKQWIIF